MSLSNTVCIQTTSYLTTVVDCEISPVSYSILRVLSGEQNVLNSFESFVNHKIMGRTCIGSECCSTDLNYD